MMWPISIKAWLTLVNADSTLRSVLGVDDDGVPHIYPAGTQRPFRVPSVEYSRVIGRETELFSPDTAQIDYFARNEEESLTIGGRIYTLTHRDVWRTLPLSDDEYAETIRLSTRYADGRDHPNNKQAVHKSMDFIFEPLRARFYQS